MTQPNAANSQVPRYVEDLRRAMIPELLSVEDVAFHMRISANRARERITSGSLGPYSRTGRRLFVRRASFLAALEASEVQPQPALQPRPPIPPAKDEFVRMLERRKADE